MENVKKVVLRPSAGDGSAVEYSQLAGGTLVVTLSNGEKIDIELFEREPGVLQVAWQNGQMLIEPLSSNRVAISRRKGR